MIYDFKLRVDGKEENFVFELTRSSMCMAEARGVNIFAITQAPLTALTGFIYAGLLTHHGITWEQAQTLSDLVLKQYNFDDFMIFMAEATDSVFTSEDSSKTFSRPRSREEIAKETMKKTSSTSKKSKISLKTTEETKA